MNEDNNKNNQLSSDKLDRFLALQAKELDIREKELEQSTLSQANDHEYALRSLDAQVKDRECTRQHESKNIVVRYGFAAVIILGLFGVFGIAIAYGKDQIVMEVIKAIVFLGTGALGGYSWRGKQSKSNGNDE